jgi:Bacterial membrane flanked domain.
MPRQGIRLRGGDILMIPFSLLWGGFAFFWEYSVLQQKDAPVFFALWGIPFVLAGIYIILGRFFVDSYQRSRTFYAVTDHRVLIVSGLFNREIKSLSLSNLSEMSLQERADGSGSILFGPSNPLYAMWAGTSWPGMSKRMAPAFDLVEDVRHLYEVLRATQRRAS